MQPPGSLGWVLNPASFNSRELLQADTRAWLQLSHVHLCRLGIPSARVRGREWPLCSCIVGADQGCQTEWWRESEVPRKYITDTSNSVEQPCPPQQMGCNHCTRTTLLSPVYHRQPSLAGKHRNGLTDFDLAHSFWCIILHGCLPACSAVFSPLCS